MPLILNSYNKRTTLKCIASTGPTIVVISRSVPIYALSLTHTTIMFAVVVLLPASSPDVSSGVV
jgi:hypothetical protein